MLVLLVEQPQPGVGQDAKLVDQRPVEVAERRNEQLPCKHVDCLAPLLLGGQLRDRTSESCFRVVMRRSVSPLLSVDLGEDNQPPVDSPVTCEAPRRASRLERGAILSSEEPAALELTGRGPAERAPIRSRGSTRERRRGTTVRSAPAGGTRAPERRRSSLHGKGRSRRADRHRHWRPAAVVRRRPPWSTALRTRPRDGGLSRA